MRKREQKIAALGGSITEVLKGLGLYKKFRQYRVWEVWDSVVGDRIASVAQPERLDFDTLFVAVSDSLWLQQLSYLQEEILEKLNKELGLKVINRIYFRLGKPEGREAARSPRNRAPSLPEIGSEEMNTIDNLLRGLKDAESRARLRSIMAKSAALDKLIGKDTDLET